MSVRASSTVLDTAALAQWSKQDRRQMLHALVRVNDVQASVDWYTRCFGAKVLEASASGATVAFGPQSDGFFALRLSAPPAGAAPVTLGEGFGHFGLAVADAYKAAEAVRAAGGKVTREPGPVKGGTTVIAFVEDPTGYKWELIQRPQSDIQDPVCQVMLRVLDLDKSIKFYTEVLGLNLLRTRENPEYKYSLGFCGYGETEAAAPVFELTYNWGREHPYDKGERPGYAHTVVATDDVAKTAAAARVAGARVTQEPGPLPGSGARGMVVEDPDGWEVVFVDRAEYERELQQAAGSH